MVTRNLSVLRCAVAAFCALAMPGCLGSGAVHCDDGSVCPPSTACDTVHHACVRPDQLSSCTGKQPGERCPIHAADDGFCDQGICTDVVCGDGIVIAPEQCDDGAGNS